MSYQVSSIKPLKEVETFVTCIFSWRICQLIEYINNIIGFDNIGDRRPPIASNSLP